MEEAGRLLLWFKKNFIREMNGEHRFLANSFAHQGDSFFSLNLRGLDDSAKREVMWIFLKLADEDKDITLEAFLDIKHYMIEKHLFPK
jgi:hypothetical protein